MSNSADLLTLARLLLERMERDGIPDAALAACKSSIADALLGSPAPAAAVAAAAPARRSSPPLPAAPPAALGGGAAAAPAEQLNCCECLRPVVHDAGHRYCFINGRGGEGYDSEEGWLEACRAAAQPAEPAAAELPAAESAQPAAGPVSEGRADLQEMCAAGALYDGMKMYIKRRNDTYVVTLRLGALGARAATLVSLPTDGPAGWEGGTFSNPSAFLNKTVEHITPEHPRRTKPGNGWSQLRYGSRNGPLLNELRQLYKSRGAAEALAAARVGRAWLA